MAAPFDELAQRRLSQTPELAVAQFLISAAHKSSGKTTVSVGIAAALKSRGLSVQTFKKGPDYIDPMWLGLASGRSCRNLDFFLMQRDEITELYAEHAASAAVAFVEGNKGLFDGLDLDGSNSNSALARLLGLPVVLVIDARGMTRGIAPLLLGYQAFEPDLKIAGVILNHLGGSRHEGKLRAVIEHYTDLEVFGAIGHDASLTIEERHLGLIPSNESERAEAHVSALGQRIAATVDLDRLLGLESAFEPQATERAPRTVTKHKPLRIGIARDRAFGFYYADDIEWLERNGVELVPFDTLNDRKLPAVDGMFIGGGFPELAMDTLAANRAARTEIRAAIDDGLPVYAECGGLMYLARSLSWGDSKRDMVGAIDADVIMCDRPVGRGYVRLVQTDLSPWRRHDDCSGRVIAAHEFHYSTMENLPADTRFAYRVIRGHGVDGEHDGIIINNLFASYSHLRSMRAYNWAERFADWVRVCTGKGARAGCTLNGEIGVS